MFQKQDRDFTIGIHMVQWIIIGINDITHTRLDVTGMMLRIRPTIPKPPFFQVGELSSFLQGVIELGPLWQSPLVQSIIVGFYRFFPTTCHHVAACCGVLWGVQPPADQGSALSTTHLSERRWLCGLAIGDEVCAELLQGEPVESSLIQPGLLQLYSVFMQKPHNGPAA